MVNAVSPVSGSHFSRPWGRFLLISGMRAASVVYALQWALVYLSRGHGGVIRKYLRYGKTEGTSTCSLGIGPTVNNTGFYLYF